MAFDSSLYDYNAGYYMYQFPEGSFWLPGKMVPNGRATWSRRAVDAAINADLDDSDIIIATYPKTGQTWALTVLRFIRQAQDLEDGKDISLSDFYQQIPFIEAQYSNGKTGVDVFNKLSPPRCIKTHLPFPLWKRQLEKHPNLRIIQTIRNPKDALVSYYHHCRSDGQLGGFHGSWDQFFEIFKEGKLPWGDFFQHNAEWYRFNKTRKNSLILRFEEMKHDPRAHVVKIAKFSGYDLCDKTIDLIVEKSSIQQVSEKFRPIQESNASWNDSRSNFIRKGEVGDWVNYFSTEQSDYIDTKCKEYLEPLGILF